jgi:hypothetical protein
MCETMCYVACNNFEPLLCPLMSLCSIMSYVCLNMLEMNGACLFVNMICLKKIDSPVFQTGCSGFLVVLRKRNAPVCQIGLSSFCYT